MKKTWIVSGYKDNLPIVKLKVTLDGKRMDYTIIEGPRTDYGFSSWLSFAWRGGLPPLVWFLKKRIHPHSDSEILDAVANFLKELALIEVNDLKIEPIEL